MTQASIARAAAAAALGSLLALVGCGGGGSDTPPPAETPSGTGGGGSGGAHGGTGGGGAPNVLACDASKTCPTGKACCAGICVDTATDAQHCGATCMPCPAGATCKSGVCELECLSGLATCNGQCVDTATDKLNCGKCGTACVYANATAKCASGACAIDACKQGFGDCDKDAKNGCESDLTSDSANCGACGKPCATVPHAKTVCSQGKCGGIQCDTGFADCDGDPKNGCEVDLQNDPTHCGDCKTKCAAVAHGTPGCNMGACSVGTCDKGYADCDKSLFDGCESVLATDVDNCGACGQKCPDPSGGVAACVASKCNVGSCQPGFDDCDGNPANGCETDLSKDPSHCGACGVACPAVSNGTAKCEFFQCGATCDAGYADCFGDGSGCQTSLGTDVAHCGACNVTCGPYPHATAGCEQGQCSILNCDDGFLDCDLDAGNGCEADLANDPKHCGSCPGACPAPPHGTPACSGGVCGLGACAAGYSDCDADPSNGCEKDTTSDPKNCGGCNVLCGSGTCQNGTCACTKTVLVVEDDSPSGAQALVGALTNAGWSVSQSAVPVWQYDGTNPPLAGFGAVVVLSGGPPGQPSTSSDMPQAGQQAILDFANAGNGVVLTEWAALHVSAGRWQTLAPIVLLTRTLSFSGQVEYDVDPAFATHPIWANLPASFTFASTSNVGVVSTVPGTTRVAGSPQAVDAVALREYPGTGRVVHLAHAGDYAPNGWANANIQQLVVNAVGWVARCD